MSTRPNDSVSIKLEPCGNGKKGESDQYNIDNILQLLKDAETGNNISVTIQKIREILQHKKSLFTHKYCKDNKIRSILHIAKFDSKISYEFKQNIIDTIVGEGYNTFKLSRDSGDNTLALFFAAAKGDADELERIIKSFKDTDQRLKLHDTREGDTLLSFIIKFGTHSANGLLTCVDLVLKEEIDSNRVDYYKKNVMQIIENELKFAQTRCPNYLYMEKLEEIYKKLKEYTKKDNICKHVKHKLFQMLIMGDQLKFFEVLTRDSANLDDGENTLLQLAIIKNNSEAVKELLKKGANPNFMVAGRNEELPVLLAAKLSRNDILKQLLDHKRIMITQEIFGKFVNEIQKSKALNYLLESKAIDVDLEYKQKIPLFYAIKSRNKNAIQSLLQRGSRITDSCLQNISPNDLEDYFNSCIRFDNRASNLDEGSYNTFLIFDVFIQSSKVPAKNGKEEKQNDDIESKSDQSTPLNKRNQIPTEDYQQEISLVRKIGESKRHKYLLEHPLIYIYILLKWRFVLKYYYWFVIVKFSFYIVIAILIYTGTLTKSIVTPVVLIQTTIVSYNFWELKWNFKQYTLDMVLDFLLVIGLIAILILQAVGGMEDEINEISAFAIIFTSISILITIGYHIELSKWMAMAKRVFKNFCKLLIFFMIPITAFATAFNLLNSKPKEAKAPSKEETENTDFANLPKAVFRTMIMLAGDIGDKKFSTVGGYILFILFAITMAILLLNFWTGVAVSDIKEIEEQSVVVAFKNVMVFIESTEKFYHLIRRLFPCIKFPPPFLKSKVQSKKGRKFQYGVNVFINSRNHFKNDVFCDCRVPSRIIAKIKLLAFENKDTVDVLLKEVIEKTNKIEDLFSKLNKLEQMLQHRSTRNTVNQTVCNDNTNTI